MKKIITGILCLGMLLQVNANVFAKEYPQKFWDVPKDHWAFQYVAELVDRGVIAGYEDGSFKPNNTVTRAEWAKMMVQVAGVKTDDEKVYYNDMQGHWAIKYVNAAKEYLTAFSDGSYRPNQAATREDVTMAMVKLKGYDLNEVDYSCLAIFSDMNSVSNYMKPHVALAIQKGLISGYEDNTFRGQATLTRAEAATLLQRAFSLGSDNKVTNAPTEEYVPATQSVVDSTQSKNDGQAKNDIANVDEDKTSETVTDIKPYKIETLAHMEKKDVSKYTAYDGNETLYYFDDNKIYALTANGSTAEVFDIDDMDIEEDFAEKEFVLNAMCCDTNGALYIAGGYSKYEYNLYKIKNGTAQDTAFKCEDIRGETLCSNRPVLIVGGNYVCSYDAEYEYSSNYDRNGTGLMQLGNRKTGEVISQKYAICAVEYNDNIIVADEEGIYEYDYNSPSQISDSYGTVGLSNDGYVVEQYGKFIIRTFDKKSEIKFSINDCVVNDKISLNSKNIAKKLFLMPDNSIIFYDISAQAFRKISNNVA